MPTDRDERIWALKCLCTVKTWRCWGNWMVVDKHWFCGGLAVSCSSWIQGRLAAVSDAYVIWCASWVQHWGHRHEL